MASSSGKGTKVPYRCSCCGKSQEQVRKLIAGQGVYICDECITLCQEIIEEEMLDTPKAARGLTSVPFTGAAPKVRWRIQGASAPDPVRGPMNNGGLYGEREGWHLPGFRDRD